jgi:hypothetical protein
VTPIARVSGVVFLVVHRKPETESRLRRRSASTGRAPDELVEDALSGCLAELNQVRNLLDSRYDQANSGAIQPIDGEEAVCQLRTKN